MTEKLVNKTILVLEDEIPLQNAINSKLKSNGFNVITARRVINGIDILENEENVDAIWLDHYLLGKEDGLDFVTKIKNDIRWKSIPIFVVSNTASDHKLRAYLQLGVNKYYTKADNKLEDIIGDINISINKKEKYNDKSKKYSTYRRR
ncbi:MAG: response regulator [Patescibacteria group bacterium]|jgi:CheY-like chemotaxis protein